MKEKSTASKVFAALNTLKVVFITFGLITCWVRATIQRTTQLDVTNELSRRDLINMTVHHDVFIGNDSYNSKMDDALLNDK